MNISVRITGDKNTRQRLQKLGGSITKFKPEFEEIGSELETYFSGKVFASQGGIIGARWAPLSKSYATWKAIHYPGRPPMVRTGKMMTGFRHTAQEQQLEVYNRMPYFVYHQSSAARKKIPYRPSLGVNDEVKGIVMQIIERGVRKRIDGVTL